MPWVNNSCSILCIMVNVTEWRTKTTKSKTTNKLLILILYRLQNSRISPQLLFYCSVLQNEHTRPLSKDLSLNLKLGHSGLTVERKQTSHSQTEKRPDPSSPRDPTETPRYQNRGFLHWAVSFGGFGKIQYKTRFHSLTLHSQRSISDQNKFRGTRKTRSSSSSRTHERHCEARSFTKERSFLKRTSPQKS